MKLPWKVSKRSTPAVFNIDGESAVIEQFPVETRTPKKSSGGAPFPSFQSTAGDQLDPKARDGLASVRMRLRNSYTPSQPVTDWRLFAGRTEILTALIRATEDGRLHTVLYGERGIGKTSILHVFAQAARAARYLVCYVSCGASSNFDETFRAVAEDIPLLYHSAYGPTSAEAEKGSSLVELLPDGPVSVRHASDLCAKLIGTRVLIVLDEFDRADSKEFRLNVAEFLKNLSDRSVRVQMVIAGVAANLTELVGHIPSVQRNVFSLEVPPLSDEEARQLVRNGETASGVKIADKAVDFIVSVSNGLPYLATLVSHHAGLNAIDAGRTTVTPQDVSDGITVALTELLGRISKRSQDQISLCIQEGAHRYLGPLSGAAQPTGGRFDLKVIQMLWPDADSCSRGIGLVDGLAAQNIILEAEHGDNGRCYRFLEDSVPAYLWLYTARENFLPGRPAELHAQAAAASP
jgi:hypothetical protein